MLMLRADLTEAGGTFVTRAGGASLDRQVSLLQTET